MAENGSASKGTQITVAVIGALALIISAIIGLLKITSPGPSDSHSTQSSSFPTSPPNLSFFTVSAKLGWQKTPFSIDPAHSWTLHQVSGAWTVDRNTYRFTDARGYDSADDSVITSRTRGACKVDASQPYGALLARVGSSLESADLVYGGGDFSGTWLAADGNRKVDGPVWLRINDKDECLGDNEGSIKVVFRLEK